MDYLQPTAAEMPRVGTLICEDAPSPGNPLGAKGAGEGGVTAAGAALAGAVDDALGLRGGVCETPMAPDAVRALATASSPPSAAVSQRTSTAAGWEVGPWSVPATHRRVSVSMSAPWRRSR